MKRLIHRHHALVTGLCCCALAGQVDAQELAPMSPAPPVPATPGVLTPRAVPLAPPATGAAPTAKITELTQWDDGERPRVGSGAGRGHRTSGWRPRTGLIHAGSWVLGGLWLTPAVIANALPLAYPPPRDDHALPMLIPIAGPIIQVMVYPPTRPLGGSPAS